MSSWQDWTIFVGQIVLALTLIPTVRNRIQIPIWTSLPAVIVLGSFIVCFATLGLYVSAASSLANTVMWAMILRNGVRSQVGAA